ncbi:ATP-binding cassette domain-containing protein [Gemella sp. GH3]|uniref:energy-coupling factor transporter ATPase n=1 Tax=unclassified Gemella TaxID=2624949 RepID=UPI0015D0A630|nr:MULTISPECIES: energy-coupling factor transporter ATPase [unclassified Gemella]MBF0713197.1 ATP-binding cassette domain-containing protein [Gemella sp. GH3.1]NYS50149.1 ATP-binding cassette domain-containing protein [Gemella sp. GH3]
MLEFRDVSFRYTSTDDYILKNINFKINTGEWLTILGSNGSGKTTLLKLIYGQVKQNSGSIYYNNEELTDDNFSNIINDLAVVFQNPDSQFVGNTVEEDIAFGLENRNFSRDDMEKIITEMLIAVDMENLRKKEPKDLSGGQKQRVAIASALALYPKILILDEATSMLDPKARKQLLKYIKKLQLERNITVISITHDVDEIKYSDSIILLNKGNIVINDKSANLYNLVYLLEKYDIAIPFLEKLKKDINQICNKDIFIEKDSKEDIIEKLCKLISKK